MDIVQLVDELEAAVSKSFRIPFTSNILISEDDLFDILDQMRISVPQEIKEARRTEAERERILARAQEEAGKLNEMAKEKILSAVDDHEIVEVAKSEAREVIAQAEAHAHQLRFESNNYVADNLSDLEEHLLQLLTTVRNGLHQIQEMQPAPSISKPGTETKESL